jgi:hypothetical protein
VQKLIPGVPQYSIDFVGVTIAEGGQILVPVWAMVPGFSDIIDVVSFDIAKPADWTMETGAGRFLGADSLLAAQSATYTWPLFLHATPLSWLEDGCRGSCILFPRTIPSELAGVRQVAVREEVAPRLDRLLREFGLRRPQIMIFEDEREAA